MSGNKKLDKASELQQNLQDERDVIEATYSCFTVGPKWSIDKPNTQVIRRGNQPARELTQKEINSFVYTRLIFFLVGTQTEKNRITMCMEIILQKQYPKFQAEVNILKHSGLLEQQVDDLLTKLRKMAVDHAKNKELVLWNLLECTTESLQRMNSEAPEDNLLAEYYKNQQLQLQQPLLEQILPEPEGCFVDAGAILKTEPNLNTPLARPEHLHPGGIVQPLFTTDHFDLSFNGNNHTNLNNNTTDNENDNHFFRSTDSFYSDSQSASHQLGFNPINDDDDDDDDHYVMFNINSEQLESDPEHSTSFFSPLQIHPHSPSQLQSSQPLQDTFDIGDTFESFLSSNNALNSNGLAMDNFNKSIKPSSLSKKDKKCDKECLSLKSSSSKSTKIDSKDTKSGKHDKKDSKKSSTTSSTSTNGTTNKKTSTSTSTPTPSPASTPQHTSLQTSTTTTPILHSTTNHHQSSPHFSLISSHHHQQPPHQPSSRQSTLMSTLSNQASPIQTSNNTPSTPPTTSFGFLTSHTSLHSSPFLQTNSFKQTPAPIDEDLLDFYSIEPLGDFQLNPSKPTFNASSHSTSQQQTTQPSLNSNPRPISFPSPSFQTPQQQQPQLQLQPARVNTSTLPSLTPQNKSPSGLPLNTNLNNMSFPDSRFSHTQPPQLQRSHSDSSSFSDDVYGINDDNLPSSDDAPLPPTQLIPLFNTHDNSIPPKPCTSMTASTSSSTGGSFLAECRTPGFYAKSAPSQHSEKLHHSSRSLLESNSTPSFLPHSPNAFSLPMSPALSSSIPLLHPMPPPLPQLEPFFPISNESSSRYLLDFHHISHLGKGGQGRVFLARHKMSELEYAVKRIRLDPKDEQQQKLILAEMKTLATLQHPYVCRYFHSWAESSQGIQTIEEIDPITNQRVIRGLTSGSDNPDLLDDVDDENVKLKLKKKKNKRLNVVNNSAKTQHSLLNNLDDDMDSLYDSSDDSDEDDDYEEDGYDSDISVHVDYDPDIDFGPPPEAYIQKKKSTNEKLTKPTKPTKPPNHDFVIDWGVDNNKKANKKSKKAQATELNMSHSQHTSLFPHSNHNNKPLGKSAKYSHVDSQLGGLHAHAARSKTEEPQLNSQQQRRLRDKQKRDKDFMIRQKQKQYQKRQLDTDDGFPFSFALPSIENTKSTSLADPVTDDEDSDEDDSDSDSDDPFSRMFNKQHSSSLNKEQSLSDQDEDSYDQDEDEDSYDEDESDSSDSDDFLSRVYKKQAQSAQTTAQSVPKVKDDISDQFHSLGFAFATQNDQDSDGSQWDEDEDWDEDWDEDGDGDQDNNENRPQSISPESSDIELFPFQTNSTHTKLIQPPIEVDLPISSPHSLFHQYLYISMEYCNQDTLHTSLSDENNQLDLNKAWRIVRQLLDALKYIHQQGVVHRDIKPQNIFISSDGVKLGDFGLAFHEDQVDVLASAATNLGQQHNALLDPMSAEMDDQATFSKTTLDSTNFSRQNTTGDGGTQLYASPEQLGQVINPHTHKKVKAGPKSDIFALGLVLCEIFFNFSTGTERSINFAAIRSTGKVPQSVMNDFEKKYKPLPPNNFSQQSEISNQSTSSLYGVTDVSSGNLPGSNTTLSNLNQTNDLHSIAMAPIGTSVNSNNTNPEMEEYLQKKASYDRDYKNIPKLIEWMCSSKPDQRPSARELLSSNLIPVLHNDDLLELITSCIDPTSPYYHQIINKLFAQNGYHAHTRSSTHKTNPELIYKQKFDFTSAPLKLDIKSYSQSLYIREFVTNCLRGVLKLHNFVHIPSPQLLPYAEVKDLLVHSLPLMRQEDGALLQLPHHLSLSFMNFLSRHHDILSLSYTSLATSKYTTPGTLSPSFELRRYDTGIYSQVSKNRTTLTNRQSTVCDITWLLHSQKHFQELKQLAIYEKQVRDYETGGVVEDTSDPNSQPNPILCDVNDLTPTYTLEQLSKKHLWPTKTYNHIITKLAGDLDLVYMEEIRRTSFVFAEALFMSASALSQLYIPALTISYTHRRLISYLVTVISRAVPEALVNSDISTIGTVESNPSPSPQAQQINKSLTNSNSNNSNPNNRETIDTIQNSIHDILSILVHQIFKSQHYLETKIPNYFNMQFIENNNPIPDVIPNPDFYNSILSQSKTTSILSQNNNSTSRKPSSRAQAATQSSSRSSSNSNISLPQPTISPHSRDIVDQGSLSQYFKSCSRCVDFIVPYHALTIDQQQQFGLLLSNFSEQSLNEQSRDLAEKIHPAYLYILYLCVTVRIPVIHVPTATDGTLQQFTKLCTYLHSVLDLLLVTPQLINHFEPESQTSNAYAAIVSTGLVSDSSITLLPLLPPQTTATTSIILPPKLQLVQILSSYTSLNSIPINSDVKKRSFSLLETSSHLYFKHIPTTFLGLSSAQTPIVLEHILFTSLRELAFIQDYSQRFQLLRHQNNFHVSNCDGAFKSFEEYALHQEHLIKQAESRTFPTPIIHFQFSLSASLMHSYEDMKDTPLFVFHGLVESKKSSLPLLSVPSSTTRTPHFTSIPTPTSSEKSLLFHPRLTLTNHSELQHSATPTTIFSHTYKSNELLSRYNPNTFLSGIHISFDHETIVSWLNKLFSTLPASVLSQLHSQALQQPLLFSSPQNVQIMMQYQLDQSQALNRLRNNISTSNNIYQNISAFERVSQLFDEQDISTTTNTSTNKSTVPRAPLISTLQHVYPPFTPDSTTIIDSTSQLTASSSIAKALAPQSLPPVMARKIPTTSQQQTSKELSRLQRFSEYIQQHFKYKTYKLSSQLSPEEANFRAAAIDFASDQHRSLTQLLQTQCTSIIIYGDPGDSFRRQRLQISEVLWGHNFSVEHVYTNSGQAHVQIAQQRGARFRLYLNSAGMQQNQVHISEYNSTKRQFGPQHNVAPDFVANYLIGLIIQSASQFNTKIRNKLPNLFSQSQINFKQKLKSSSAFYVSDIIAHALDTTIVEQPLNLPTATSASQKDPNNSQQCPTTAGNSGINPSILQINSKTLDQQQNSAHKKHSDIATDKLVPTASNNQTSTVNTIHHNATYSNNNCITLVQLQSQRNNMSKINISQIAQHLGPGIMMIAHEILVVPLDLKQLQQVALVIRENSTSSLTVLQNSFYASIGVKQTKQETKLSHQQQLQMAALEIYVRSAKTVPTDKSKFIILYSPQSQSMEIIHR